MVINPTDTDLPSLLGCDSYPVAPARILCYDWLTNFYIAAGGEG